MYSLLSSSSIEINKKLFCMPASLVIKGFIFSKEGVGSILTQVMDIVSLDKVLVLENLWRTGVVWTYVYYM